MVIKERSIKELTAIPGVGKSIANDLWNIGIQKIADLKGRDPDVLYDLSNRFSGIRQDRCLLYVYRCAVYFADTPVEEQEKEKLKWWNWKDIHSR
jgi:nucleotidyltransferase/DNA polymerase involved in DNA repair